MDRGNASNEALLNWFSDLSSGPTILIVEDEPMIGRELLTIISERGGKPLGPYSSIGTVRTAIANVHIDGAILDLDLNGDMNFELADLLTDARIPFVIYTGVDSLLLPRRHSVVPCLQKPFTGSDVVDRVLMAIDG
jgi:DNA-binding LytR/AlgR family response regulator